MATIGCTETFEDVERLMYSVIHKYWRRYGGEFDEWRSEGHRVFMRAYTTYKPENGSFHSWFYFLLVKLFMERIRRETMHNVRHRREYMDFSYLASRSTKAFDADDYCDVLGLSDDARWVVELVTDSPFDIRLALCDKEDARSNVKGALKEFLRDAGWSTKRIFESFREIREALSP